MQTTAGCEQDIPDEVPKNNLADNETSDMDDEEDNGNDMTSEEVDSLSISEADSVNLQSSGSLFAPSQGSAVSSYITGIIIMREAFKLILLLKQTTLLIARLRTRVLRLTSLC